MAWSLKQCLLAQKGQTLLIVLVLLALGGMIVIPGLSFAATSLNHERVTDTGVKAIYAADAGIEDVIWSLKGGASPHTCLSENPNDMQVTMSTDNRGVRTLVAGQWVTAGESHSQDLSITTSMVWDENATAYKYTIAGDWSGPGQCKLTGVGARLPVGYGYKPLSAAIFGSNLSNGEPGIQSDNAGAQLLQWTFSKTDITTCTQEFYATGNGSLERDYGWAEATRQDVGTVGELIGTFYTITASATGDGILRSRVKADVMISGSNPTIISYRVTK